jgi:hypothetical protein
VKESSVGGFVFGTILVSVATMMHWHVFWRASSVPFVSRRVPRSLLVTAGAVLWAILVFGRFNGHGGDGAVAAVVESIGMSWLAALFLAFVSFFIVDIVTGFGYLFPRQVPLLRGCALFAGGVLTAVAIFQGTRPPVVDDYEIRLPGRSRGRCGPWSPRDSPRSPPSASRSSGSL